MDVGDLKKLLKGLKGAPLEGKVDEALNVARSSSNDPFPPASNPNKMSEVAPGVMKIPNGTTVRYSYGLNRKNEQGKVVGSQAQRLQSGFYHLPIVETADGKRIKLAPSNIEEIVGSRLNVPSSGTTPKGTVQQANEAAKYEFLLSDGPPPSGPTPKHIVDEANEAARKQAEEYLRSEGIEPPKPISGREFVEKARREGMLNLKPKHIQVQNPFDEKEVFQFPEGTDEKNAKEMVRLLLIKRAREGEMKIELPSELPDERTKELDKANSKIEELEQKVKDLSERNGLKRVEPGVWLDENTNKYWQVDGEGNIKEWLPDSES